MTTLNTLDPCGRIHMPIGIINTVDQLKTFVEAEGSFSPGCGSYGVYVWVYDREEQRLFAPTVPDVPVTYGVHPRGYLIPWSRWQSEGVTVTTHVCQVSQDSPCGLVHVVGSRVSLENTRATPKSLSLYVVIRPLGPAGFPIHELTARELSLIHI